jgi:multicomponent Na+:H+ antiporter subunit A
MLTGAVSALFLRQRIAVLMASGLVGYGSAVLFLFAGAPDLALHPVRRRNRAGGDRRQRLAVFAGGRSRASARQAAGHRARAVAAGVATFLLLAHLAGLPENTELADWFAAHSLPAAHGRNVVNVIIVDFRAFDTLGEIAVLAFSCWRPCPCWPGCAGKRRDSVA